MIQLKNKNVVVFGLGVSGLSALKLLKVLGASVFAINNGEISSWATGSVLENCPLLQCASESDPKAIEFIKTANLIILSPGIPREHKILDFAHQNQIPVWGEIELGYKVLEARGELRPVVAITGTNGKTTTTTFLGEILKNAGFNPFVGGNIGIPLCDMALEVIVQKNPYDYIVLELSSFQLESTFDFRANYSIILNVFQNHGERYAEILDYAKAKFNIVNKMQSNDLLIYPTDYPIIDSWANKLSIRKIGFDTRNFKIDFDITKFKLPGNHNLVNLNFLLILCEDLKIPHDVIQKSINDFNGVHHRIEFIPNNLGFTAYNDAKSTNWDATITAVHAMEKCPKNLYLIIGGKKRGHGDSILPYIEILKKSVARFYLIGEMGNEIESELKGIAEYKNLVDLDSTVKDIISENFKGTLLFSPAFPSFDQFKNYAHRGECFVNLLK